MTGLTIRASYRTFPAKLTTCLTKSNLVRKIYHMLSMENSLNLQKKMNVRTIFNPYCKHCNDSDRCDQGIFCRRKKLPQ